VERYEREEKKSNGNGDRQGSAFAEWVPGFIETNYNRPETAKTFEAYGWRWHTVQKFLTAQQIKYPRQISYAHAWKYLEWRKSGAEGVKAASHNTALHEVKFLSMLMTQAVRRGSHNAFNTSQTNLQSGVSATSTSRFHASNMAQFSKHFATVAGHLFSKTVLYLLFESQFSSLVNNNL
jgi:hypothetical protein